MAWIVKRQRADGRQVAHVQWRDAKGKVHSRSLGTADPAIAEMERRLVEQREEGAAEGPRLKDDAAQALKDFVQHVRLTRSQETAEFYEEKLGRVFAAFAKTGVQMPRWRRSMLEDLVAAHALPLEQIEQPDGTGGKGRKGRPRRPWSPRMVAMHVTACKRFIAWAAEHDVACPDFVGKFKGPTVYRGEPKVLSREQLQALLEAAKGTDLEVPVALAGLAGLRRKEWKFLDVKDVDWDGLMLTVRGWKTHRDRSVNLSPQLLEVLKTNRPAAGPICRYDPEPWGQHARLHALCDRARVPPCGWHTLRHTYATLLVRAGARLTSVRDLLGHTNLATTSRYAHSSNEDRREDVARAFG